LKIDSFPGKGTKVELKVKIDQTVLQQVK